MKTSKIILGTAQLIKNYGICSLNTTVKDFEEILKLAKKNNINCIDTAISYPNVLKKLSKLDLSGFKIINKFPKIKSQNVNDLSKEIHNFLDKSYQNLKEKKIDTLLLHDLDDIKDNDKVNFFIKNIIELKKKYQINKFGISIYDPKILNEINYLDQIDVIQAPFNLIDRELEKSKILNTIKKKN